MSNGTRLFGIFTLLTIFIVNVHAGQNENAVISFDFDKSPGNQGVSSIDAPGTGAFVKFEVRVDNCSQLDSYSFQLLYSTDDLIYTNFSTQNVPLEKNILNQKGNYLFDSPVVTNDDSGPVGILTISVVNTTSEPANCPSGEGLLGLVEFYTQVAAPKSIQLGEVVWKDPNLVEDLCKAENKGEFFMGGGSLPVELSLFTGRAAGDYILLQWRTESEKESWGFNVLRSEIRDGTYERINGELIKAAGNSTSRHDYSYKDERFRKGVTYYYKLEQIDLNGTTNYYGPIEVTSQSGVVPESFVVSDNYPNPFNPETRFKFALPQAEFVTIEIYNIAGAKIRTLISAPYNADVHTVVWDGTNDTGDKVSSGAYLYQFKAGAFIKTGKMILLN
ncbi:T9SS type A sorting domain-containing protein [candidate division KSB1 bacterium]|nr:T9SS type A sorting domain-containing protein [candidate division KSB1 bacterium]